MFSSPAWNRRWNFVVFNQGVLQKQLLRRAKSNAREIIRTSIWSSFSSVQFRYRSHHLLLSTIPSLFKLTPFFPQDEKLFKVIYTITFQHLYSITLEFLFNPREVTGLEVTKWVTSVLQTNFEIIIYFIYIF